MFSDSRDIRKPNEQFCCWWPDYKWLNCTYITNQLDAKEQQFSNKNKFIWDSLPQETLKCAIEDRTSPNHLKLKLLGGCFTIIYKFCDISFILSKRKVACKSEYDQFRKSRLSRVPNDGATKYLPDNQLYNNQAGLSKKRGPRISPGYRLLWRRPPATFKGK